MPVNPAHPERVCWGCDRYCAAGDLRCGNGTIRTQHPVEIFGRDWLEHGLDAEASPADSMRPPAEAGGQPEIEG